MKQKLSMCKFVLKTIKGPYIFAFHPELNPAWGDIFVAHVYSSTKCV